VAVAVAVAAQVQSAQLAQVQGLLVAQVAQVLHMHLITQHIIMAVAVAGLRGITLVV
jgi:hypothetical protein